MLEFQTRLNSDLGKSLRVRGLKLFPLQGAAKYIRPWNMCFCSLAQETRELGRGGESRALLPTGLRLFWCHLERGRRVSGIWELLTRLIFLPGHLCFVNSPTAAPGPPPQCSPLLACAGLSPAPRGWAVTSFPRPPHCCLAVNDTQGIAGLLGPGLGREKVTVELLEMLFWEWEPCTSPP